MQATLDIKKIFSVQDLVNLCMTAVKLGTLVASLVPLKKYEDDLHWSKCLMVLQDFFKILNLGIKILDSAENCI